MLRGFVGASRAIEAVQHDPKSYDLIVIGTPVWTASVSTPVRGYLRAHSQDLRNVAFFATMGHRGSIGAFVEMQKLVGKKPLACCAVTAAQIAAGAFAPRVAQFVDEIGDHAKPARSGEQVPGRNSPALSGSQIDLDQNVMASARHTLHSAMNVFCSKSMVTAYHRAIVNKATRQP